jgi:hypothetical protein
MGQENSHQRRETMSKRSSPQRPERMSPKRTRRGGCSAARPSGGAGSGVAPLPWRRVVRAHEESPRRRLTEEACLSLEDCTISAGGDEVAVLTFHYGAGVTAEQFGQFCSEMGPRVRRLDMSHFLSLDAPACQNLSGCSQLQELSLEWCSLTNVANLVDTLLQLK